MDLLDYLEVDKKIFYSINKFKRRQNKKPILLAFLTPSFKLFDLFRLSKLSQLAANEIFLILIIKDSEKTKMDKFENLVNQFIPKNKIVHRYIDIYSQLIKDRDFRNIFSNYYIKELQSQVSSINKSGHTEKEDISLSDIESFLVQGYVLNNCKKFLGSTPDFFLTSVYKDSFLKNLKFNRIYPINEIKITDVPYNIDFLDNTKSIERKIGLIKLTAKQENQMQNILNSIASSLNYQKYLSDYREMILFLKDKLLDPASVEELYIDNENYISCINALNNKIRRDILGLVFENRSLKAEVIRNKINKIHTKKYTLTSIIKNLDILVNSKLLKKNNRFYELNYQRIVMSIPISWMVKYNLFITDNSQLSP